MTILIEHVRHTGFPYFVELKQVVEKPQLPDNVGPQSGIQIHNRGLYGVLEKMNFSSWLNERLQESRLTAKDMAERCRISRQMVYFYLSGQRMPTSPTIQKLAEVLGVQLTAEEVLAFTRTVGRPKKRNEI